MEASLKNLIVQRQDNLKQLIQVSENYTDLKKFESVGPNLMLNVRELTLKIIIKVKQLFKYKNSEYLTHLRM
jgi:hypothetical protein